MSDTKNIRQDVRDLTGPEIEAVSGGDIFTNTGCIRISPTLPMPTYNPWLDPYSPERRFG